MKDAFYFRHDSNASSDMKLRSMRRKYGWQGIGWYWYIIECLRNEDEYYLEYSDFTFDSLSEDMKCQPEETKAFIDDCMNAYKLLKLNGEHFFSKRLKRDMATWNDKRANKAGARARGFTVPDLDEGIATMIRNYEEKTGLTLTPNDLDLLKDFAGNYTLDDFNYALDEVVNRKVKAPMKYMAKILESKKQEKKPQEDEDETEGMEVL